MANSKNNNEHFYFSPFGGVPDVEVDGIGANSSIITYQKGDEIVRIMMDFGIKLPTNDLKEKFPGISGIIPDFTQFFDTKEQKAPYPVDAIFLTHAHADHIDGLVPVFLKAQQDGMDLPTIYGSQFTLSTLKDNLKEKNVRVDDYSFKELTPYTEVECGPLTVLPFPVSHTTVESYGFLIHKDHKYGILNSGDRRSLDSHASFGGSDKILARYINKVEMVGMLQDSTSTGIQHDPKTEITLQDSLDSIQKIFDENPGKQIFTAVISRSIENLLPFLIKAKENNKMVMIDGNQLRMSFRRWKNLNRFYYADENGQLAVCYDRKAIKNLRKKGIELYCAEDFRANVYDFDNVVHAKAKSYTDKTPKGRRLVVFGGAMGEENSGAMRLAQGEHQDFSVDHQTVVIQSQRGIRGLNYEPVRKMAESYDNAGAKVYANSFGEPLGDFVTYLPLQSSGHDNAEEAFGSMRFVMRNAKNAEDFDKNNPFYVFGIHGGKDYRQTTATLADKDERMKGFVPSNFGVYEYTNGSVVEISHIPPEQQRYFVFISIPQSGQVVLTPINGYHEKNGEDDIVVSFDSKTAGVIRDSGQAMRDRALEQEANSYSRESNRQRKSKNKNDKESFYNKHNKGRKNYNKNKQNKNNAGKIRQYTGRY